MDLAFLRGVSKPTRYTGGEVNEVVKEDRPDLLHVALAFPDAYDIGMSYLGLQILYRKLNGHPDIWAERAFMPMPDMEEALAARGLPLYALESKRPLHGFDIVGFSLVYELGFTNVLNMLRMGGIPARSSERSDGHPIVLAGGPCAVNPEPLADFVDAFFIGEGEEGFLEICEVVRTSKGRPRTEVLRSLAGVPGTYVPSLYLTGPEAASGMTVVTGPAWEGAPFPVRRRILWDLDAHPFPSHTLVPLHEVVHDRFSAEIARGCAAGCRFCQAGYTTRPYRERSSGSVRSTVKGGLASTGFNEVTLLSLNAGDYGGIGELARTVAEDSPDRGVSVAMPSLRASTLTRELVDSLSSGRKSGFTLAPEAGTQRLRDVVNKNITREEVLNAAAVVFSSGWNLVKLYFMLGLPTETDEDVEAVARLGGDVVRAARNAGNRKAQVNLATSSFVPKPFTPFQWRPMERPAALLAKQGRLKQLLRRPVTYKWHDVRASVVEAVLSRGDRRLCRTLERAAELGCRLDAWTEHFRADLWERAMAETGVSPDAYAHREFTRDEVLPWDHLDLGVKKEFLWREWERALEGEATPPCAPDSCSGCAEFARRCVAGEFERKDAETRGRADAGKGNETPNRGIDDSVRREKASMMPVPSVPHSPTPPLASSPHYLITSSPHHPITSSPHHTITSSPHHPITPSPFKFRITYRKEGPAAFLGHLDLVEVLVRGLRRAGARFAYSQGFHPMPRVEPAVPLSLGVEGLAEFLDVTLIEPPAHDLAAHLNALLPRGLRVAALRPVERRDPPLSSFTLQRYRVGLSALGEEALAAVLDRADAFVRAETWQVTRRSKGGTKTVDLRARVRSMERDGDHFRVDLVQGGFMDLVELLAPGPERDGLILTRTSLEVPTELLPPPQKRPQELLDAFESSGGFRS